MNQQIVLKNLRVLICDDNPFMRRVIRSILSGYGIHHILEAGCGTEAYNLCASTLPDIMIVDLEMPDMNGIELTRIIRQSTKGNLQFVHIIMLSAHSERKYVMEARDAGITEYMCKPVSAKSLYKRIISVLTEPRSFISTSNYVGPDRRRFVHPSLQIRDRRINSANSIQIPSYVAIDDRAIENLDHE